MRSYKQYCAVARALDAIGDRWSLLVVRELMIRGASRYKDLKENLPGIATNVLAERLRDLEDVGVVARVAPVPPVATSLFRLTSRGESLMPVLRELGRWGGQFMAERSGDDVFLSHWLVMPAELHLVDHRPDDPPVRVAIRTGDQPLTVDAADGLVRVTPGEAPAPDAAVNGPPNLILAMLVGKLSIAGAQLAGLEIEGDISAVERIMPAPNA